MTERSIADQIEEIIREVAELPNRTSPDDWPEAMLVTAEELRHILAEVGPRPDPAPWQDIASAPKDGSYVLVHGTGITGIACWSPREYVWQEVGVGTILKPTHWMVLPVPPERP